MKYQIFLKPRAIKDLKNISNADAKKIATKIKEMENDLQGDVKKLKTGLVFSDWSAILQKMREYKRLRFPDDNRIVTLCAYTPRKTLRVEWK